MGELADNIVESIRDRKIYALPNKRPDISTEVSHTFEIHTLCPVTKNPRPGSTVTIKYAPGESVLDVIGLEAYLRRFRGGYVEDGEIVVRDMEHTIQRIAEDCAEWIEAGVEVTADLVIAPHQQETITCRAKP